MRLSDVRVNRKMELVLNNKGKVGNTMIGISYLEEKTAKLVKDRIDLLCKNHKYDDSFWEETLYEKEKMIVQAKVV